VKFLFFIFLLALSESANADSIYTVVGFRCDQAKDALVLTYEGAYDHAGEELVKNKKPNQWDLWTLYEKRQTIQQRCSLSDGDYELSISTYSRGSCFDCFGIWVKVIRGNKLVFDKGLDGFEGPPAPAVIARAVIKSHNHQPELTMLSWDDFVEGTPIDE
jgi:hypothetical protein